MRLLKKGFLAVILALSLCLAFAACDSNENETPEDTRYLWGTLSGTITEYADSPVDSSPVAGVTVKSGDETVTSDENGNYTIKVYDNGATVTFEKEGYITQSKTFKSSSFNSDEAEYSFIAYVSTVVTGTVKDANGSPVSGASVSIGIRQTTTDAQGKFKFDGVIGTSMVIVVTSGKTTVRKPVYTEQMRTGAVDVEVELG